MRSALARALLFVVLLANYAAVAAAQSSNGLTLARVELTSVPPSSLPTLAWLLDSAGHDYALALAPIGQLQQSDAPYSILDGNATRADDYVIARERRSGARAQAAKSFTVLYDDGRQIIVRLPFSQTDVLSALGFSLQRLDSSPLVLRTALPLHIPTSSMPDTTVAAMIAQVQSSTVSDYAARLSGEVPVTIGGASYTIATRRTDSGTAIQKATQYMYERMQALGLTVSYHNWSSPSSYCHYSNRNVVGEKIGMTRPSEIVLITAHVDDQPSITLAPGADDNASGSVAVQIAAEILRQYQFERTIRFVFFTGEEQDLCGSKAYSSYVSSLGQNVVAVENLDMIAYDSSDGPTLRLHTRTSSNPGYSGDLAIATTFVSVVNAYGLSSSLTPVVDSDGEGDSDHASFWAHGYSSIMAIEDDYDDFNDYYHTANDKLARLNLLSKT